MPMITVYDWFGYELQNKERYRLIKEAGFDGVLLWWSDGFGRDCFGRGDYRNGPQIAREAGLFIENIHAPIEKENSLWLDNLDGEAVTDCYLQCIADCAEFEIPTMVVHLPNENNPCNALGLDRMKTIADKAEQLGVNIALENLWNFSNLTYVLEQVNSLRIGFCYDSGHHYRHYPDTDLLSLYGSRLMALHLHDNNGSYAQHGLPLDGTIDWSTAMKQIAATNYSGAIAIEAMNWDYGDLSAEEFLHKAFEQAKRLEALQRYNPSLESGYCDGHSL
jgi:L-ribulose-5-phosphate 3-epimerase